jgi:hypothetical protein
MPAFLAGSQARAMSAETPMNPAVLVPTPAIGLTAEGTSST